MLNINFSYNYIINIIKENFNNNNIVQIDNDEIIHILKGKFYNCYSIKLYEKDNDNLKLEDFYNLLEISSDNFDINNDFIDKIFMRFNKLPYKYFIFYQFPEIDEINDKIRKFYEIFYKILIRISSAKKTYNKKIFIVNSDENFNLKIYKYLNIFIRKKINFNYYLTEKLIEINDFNSIPDILLFLFLGKDKQIAEIVVDWLDSDFAGWREGDKWFELFFQLKIFTLPKFINIKDEKYNKEVIDKWEKIKSNIDNKFNSKIESLKKKLYNKLKNLFPKLNKEKKDKALKGIGLVDFESAVIANAFNLHTNGGDFLAPEKWLVKKQKNEVETDFFIPTMHEKNITIKFKSFFHAWICEQLKYKVYNVLLDRENMEVMIPLQDEVVEKKISNEIYKKFNELLDWTEDSKIEDKNDKYSELIKIIPEEVNNFIKELGLDIKDIPDKLKIQILQLFYIKSKYLFKIKRIKKTNNIEPIDLVSLKFEYKFLRKNLYNIEIYDLIYELYKKLHNNNIIREFLNKVAPDYEGENFEKFFEWFILKTWSTEIVEEFKGCWLRPADCKEIAKSFGIDRPYLKDPIDLINYVCDKLGMQKRPDFKGLNNKFKKEYEYFKNENLDHYKLENLSNVFRERIIIRLISPILKLIIRFYLSLVPEFRDYKNNSKYNNKTINDQNELPLFLGFLKRIESTCDEYFESKEKIIGNLGNKYDEKIKRYLKNLEKVRNICSHDELKNKNELLENITEEKYKTREIKNGIKSFIKLYEKTDFKKFIPTEIYIKEQIRNVKGMNLRVYDEFDKEYNILLVEPTEKKYFGKIAYYYRRNNPHPISPAMLFKEDLQS